ncbi:PP2C family protein-serine/threonine phosphatase [Photobacterium indicum]|uniref:PP2C family protein-serine/threonine phosphatase n=1 Tax=Photobacterium indicum TaxID=81447 RepID=UPI003D0BB302
MRDILLVDDNRTMLMFMEKMLTKRGFNVITASDGLQALEVLKVNAHIQFVLSDWMMPEMDGIELCARLKSGDYSRYIFFVLLSGKDDQDSIINGINAGADDFVVKDTHVDELDARIRAGFRTLALHNQITEKNDELDGAYATIKKDLESAGELVRRLLPSQKKLAGVELSYVSIPSAQIGGDMLGYMQLNEDHVAFYLLDVAGHGVSSALMSFSVQQSISTNSDKGSIVKTQISEPPYYEITSPKDVLKQLNDIYLSDDENLLYFTMVYSVLNVKTGVLSFSSAGHPPLVWLHAVTNDAEFIGQESFVVGAFDFVEYQTAQIQLEPGDKVWIYSDGLTEAENGKRQFSEEGLRQAVIDLNHHSTAVQTDLLVNRVRDWQKSEQFDDDVSVLAIEWTGYSEGDQTCNTQLSTRVNAQFFK